MATVAPSSPPPGRLYRLTVDPYERMVEQGTLGEDDRVELLEGIPVPKMPRSPRHAAVAGWLAERLAGLVAPGWHVRKEDPVRIPDHDEPEPDLAVARGAYLDIQAATPARATSPSSSMSPRARSSTTAARSVPPARRPHPLPAGSSTSSTARRFH
jgi:hypothetical protein